MIEHNIRVCQGVRVGGVEELWNEGETGVSLIRLHFT